MKNEKLCGFSYSKIQTYMENIEVFFKVISSSINLLFLKSGQVCAYTICYMVVRIYRVLRQTANQFEAKLRQTSSHLIWHQLFHFCYIFTMVCTETKNFRFLFFSIFRFMPKNGGRKRKIFFFSFFAHILPNFCHLS